MDSKRIIRQYNSQLLYEQQFIKFAKELVLSSKIILDEDFTTIYESPVIHTITKKTENYKTIANICLSLSTIITLKSIKSPAYLYILSLLPVSYQFMKSYGRHKMRKQMDYFIKVLEMQKSLNSKVTKHLHTRIKSFNDLECKFESNVLDVILEKDTKFAIEAAQTLHKQCQQLQECLRFQIEYSGPSFEYIGGFKMDTIDENCIIEHAIDYIENNNELYILLASNLLSSTIFALENAMWKSHNDFMKVYNSLVNTSDVLSRNIRLIEGKLQNIFYNIEKLDFHRKPEKPSANNNLTIYRDTMDECRNKLRLIFDLTKLIESPDRKARGVSLEEMLQQNELLSGIIKTLVRYETASMNAIGIKRNNTAFEQDDTNKIIKTIKWDDVDEDVGSDDEIFAASPRQSDDEDEMNQLSGKIQNEDSTAAIAVQNLMLQELKNRMKDVRRIKITKTSDGNLLVQERSMTLEESGGQIGSVDMNKEHDANDIHTKVKENSEDDEPVRVFRLPPIPKASRPDENVMSLPVMPKSMQAAIMSLASQRNQNDDVFDYIGEDYIDSDNNQSDDE